MVVMSNLEPSENLGRDHPKSLFFEQKDNFMRVLVWTLGIFNLDLAPKSWSSTFCGLGSKLNYTLELHMQQQWTWLSWQTALLPMPMLPKPEITVTTRRWQLFGANGIDKVLSADYNSFDCNSFDDASMNCNNKPSEFNLFHSHIADWNYYIDATAMTETTTLMQLPAHPSETAATRNGGGVWNGRPRRCRRCTRVCFFCIQFLLCMCHGLHTHPDHKRICCLYTSRRTGRSYSPTSGMFLQCLCRRNN